MLQHLASHGFSGSELRTSGLCGECLLTELSPHPRMSSLKGCSKTKETCPEDSWCYLGLWQAQTLVWAHGGEVCQTHRHGNALWPLSTNPKVLSCYHSSEVPPGWGPGSCGISAPAIDSLPSTGTAGLPPHWPLLRLGTDLNFRSA